MQKVRFKEAFDHITPTRTVVYPAGHEGKVSNETVEAAGEKVEVIDGGRPDKGSAPRGSRKAEGRPRGDGAGAGIPAVPVDDPA